MLNFIDNLKKRIKRYKFTLQKKRNEENYRRKTDKCNYFRRIFK